MNPEDIVRGAELGRENDNLGGAREFLYYCDHDDLGELVWPSAPADFSEANQIAFADLNITAGNLHRMDIIHKSVEIRDEEVGETDGRAWKNEIEFAIAKNNPDNLGFASVSSNARLAFFARMNDGRFRVVGNSEFPATRAQGTAKSNKTPDEGPAAGQNYVFEAYGKGPALIVNATDAEMEGLLTA